MSFTHRFSICSFAFLIVLGMVAFHPGTASAGVGFQPISPEELKMTSDPHAPGAPAIILFRQVDRDDNGHTSHEDDYFRIKILTEEGRKYGDVEIPFFKGAGDIQGVHARTIRPDGSVVNFNGKVFVKTIVKAKGLKFLARTFTLPDVQVGSIIEYYYTDDLEELALFDSHWILSDELFTRSAKFSMKPFRNNSMNQFTLHWVSRNLPLGVSRPEEGPDGTVRLEVTNIPAFQTEDYMPPENELKARVDFAYSEEMPPKDANEYWIKTGKKLNGQLESFVGKKKAMERVVAEIVAPNDEPEVKLQKIYARVQKIRNISYEVQKTEQEENRTKEKSAKSAEDLWKSGYGDGRQLTWLFLALARAAGFEAYGVWASDRRNYFFNPAIMDKNRLDANVVLVKLNGKDLYFDPGAAFTPYGLLEWSESGVQGLRLDKEGGSWIQTTLPQSSDSRIERRANLKVTDTGDLEGKLTVTFTGLRGARAPPRGT